MCFHYNSLFKNIVLFLPLVVLCMAWILVGSTYSIATHTTCCLYWNRRPNWTGTCKFCKSTKGGLICNLYSRIIKMWNLLKLVLFEKYKWQRHVRNMVTESTFFSYKQRLNRLIGSELDKVLWPAPDLELWMNLAIHSRTKNGVIARFIYFSHTQ